MATFVTRTSGVVLIRPDGRIDDKKAPRLQQHIDESLGKESHFLIDLSATEFIGGAGLRVLLMLARRLEASHGELEICGLNSQVAESFAVAGLSSVFSISESRPQALRRLLRSSVIGSVADLASSLLDRGGETRSRGPARDASAEILELARVAERLLKAGQREPAES